jgi:hypothetical protein
MTTLTTTPRPPVAQFAHVARLLGYNMGMYADANGQEALARSAERLAISLRFPLRLLAWSTPASIAPALQTIIDLLQTCPPEAGWQAEHLEEQYRFLQALAGENDLRQNHFCAVTWTHSPQPPVAFWNTAGTFLTCPVEHLAQLPAVFTGHWHAEATHLRPYPDSPDQSYVGLYYAHAYQGNWTLDALHPLFQQPFPLALAIDIDTLPPATANFKLHMARNSLEAQIVNPAQFGGFDPGSRAAFPDVEAAADLLTQGRRLHMVRLVLAIRAPTRARLKEYADEVAGALAGLCEIAVARWQQDAMLAYFTPAHPNRLPAAAPDWPWMSGGVGILTGIIGLPSRHDTRGPLYGVDDYSGNLIFTDMFARTRETAGYNAAHTVILGQPGAGKTTLELILARRYALYNKQIIFIEPQGHSERLYRMLGRDACAYHALNFSRTQINVLDRIFPSPASQVVGVVHLLALLCTCAINAAATDSAEGRKVRQFTTAETRTLYAALEAVYAPYPWEQPLPPAETPRLEDLCRALCDLDTDTGRALADELGGLFVTSILAPIFNQPTNVDLRFQHRIICFNVLEIDEIYQPWIYTVLFQRLQRYIYTRKIAQVGELLVLVDEARHLLNQPVVLAAIHNMIKRVRTRGVAMILADQNVNTYIETPMGQDILSNAPYAFIGKLEGKDLEKVLPLFPYLNESHKHGIIVAPPGRFVYKCGREYYQLRVEPSVDEYTAFEGI